VPYEGGVRALALCCGDNKMSNMAFKGHLDDTPLTPFNACLRKPLRAMSATAFPLLRVFSNSIFALVLHLCLLVDTPDSKRGYWQIVEYSMSTMQHADYLACPIYHTVPGRLQDLPTPAHIETCPHIPTCHHPSRPSLVLEERVVVGVLLSVSRLGSVLSMVVVS